MQNDGSHGEAARRLEIFLDYLLSEATTTTAFLLKEQYDALLDPPQRKLRNELHKFTSNLDRLAKVAPEYQRVQQMLRELGEFEEDNPQYNFVVTSRL